MANRAILECGRSDRTVLFLPIVVPELVEQGEVYRLLTVDGKPSQDIVKRYRYRVVVEPAAPVHWPLHG